jgi:hypothetical protein
MRTNITVNAQRKVNNTHAREATICHENSQAINQLNQHKRQPAPILESEEIVVVDRLNRRRAKQSGRAEVRIEFKALQVYLYRAKQLPFITIVGSLM